MINQTSNKISIDTEQLYNDLMKLLKTPGPTQACVKISKDDPRITGNFPMENTIERLVKKLNKESKVKLQAIKHNGNLLIVGGLEKYNSLRKADLSPQEVRDIRDISIVFGAHLDEITYIITKKRGFLNGDNRQVFPLCAPPKRTDKKPIESKDKKTQAIEIHHPACRIVGFRGGKFIKNIGTGMLYKIVKIEERKETVLLDGEEREITTWKETLEPYLILRILDRKRKVLEGDMVIQDYGDWQKKINLKNEMQIIQSKALDDRVGCIATIYAVKELSKKGIRSKAILTSAEEGVPKDISWGRLVMPTYQKFCSNKTITLVCDGIDGKELYEFPNCHKELDTAVIVPYTSMGKGGGDIGVFSRIRDNIIPELILLCGLPDPIENY